MISETIWTIKKHKILTKHKNREILKTQIVAVVAIAKKIHNVSLMSVWEPPKSYIVDAFFSYVNDYFFLGLSSAIFLTVLIPWGPSCVTELKSLKSRVDLVAGTFIKRLAENNFANR